MKACIKALYCIKKISWITTGTMLALYCCITEIKLTCLEDLNVQILPNSAAQVLYMSRKKSI